LRWLYSRSLILQFAGMSLVIVLIIGLLLGWIIGQVLERHGIDDTAAEVQDTFQSSVRHHLGAEDFLSPMSGRRYTEFDQYVRTNLLVSQRTKRIKLWSRDGVVVYADETSLIGQQFPLEVEIKKALSGETVSRLSGLQNPENVAEAKFGRLLEVYAPVVFSDSTEIVGAFEMYQSYESVEHQIEVTRNWVYTGLAGGLLFLYVALFTIVKRASDTIIRHQSSLAAH
jgi:hypothetical protein